MISGFYKKFSLNNLQNDKPSGQIATILILVIVVVLILILTTVNLGQLSISTTNLSNSADSAALTLASQLAARANQIAGSLQKSCGNPYECCSKSWGWLAWIFIIIVVIIVTVATWGYGTPVVIAAATAAGAAAGVAAAAIAGTSVLQGAIQGAMIGAAIGGGATAVAELGPGLASFEGMAGGGITTNAAGIAMLTEEAAAAVTLATTIGAVAGGALAAGSTVYNASVGDRNQAAAFATAARMLNGLLDYDRYRESVFLQVFSQTVDDPNKDTDVDDLNGNGDIADKVSHFLYYWAGRMSYLKGIIPVLQSITNSFFKSALPTFSNYIAEELKVTEEPGVGPEDTPITISGRLSQSGNIATVAQALNPDFWDPENEISFNSMVDGFTAFTALAAGIAATDISQLTSNWQTYIKNFYNEDAGQIIEGKTITDYYHLLGEAKNSLETWKTQIKNKRNQLSSCKLGGWNWWGGEQEECQSCYGPFCPNDCIISDGPEASPIPCKLDTTINGGSLDYNINDEITPALNDVDTLINKISGFQSDILSYVTNMENTYAALQTGYGGLNPATYSWTDSRGEHSIKAQVGNYQLARTVTTKSGGGWSKTICVRLVDYSDNGANSWVEITRQDPTNKDVKSGRVSLGLWNPFFSGTIKKKGKSSYSWDRVGLTP
ncbi:MAG: pilus assembly protein TadG-related protein [Candidatus Omnitrophica bacterium]|nr:pilus assembly protein TadG-related protein [Candidatus Omnitrophota bacterium]